MYTDDSQVIGAVLHGDKNRYEELIQKYKRMVYGIAWSHLGDYDLSEDVAQETFVKAYSYLGTLRNPAAFPGWLARIARNVCNSFGRKAVRESEFVEQWALESEPASEDDHESLTDQVRHSFGTLPATYREALTVFYIEDKSLRESAAMLGISESALKARLFRARAALRAQLEQRLEDTLESLEPSKDFNRSVLASLPLAPKGVVGAGGLLALLGKLFAGLSFLFWLILGPVLASGMMLLHFKLDAANIKDTPENKRIKAGIMRGGLLPMLGMSVGMVLGFLCMFFFSFHAIFRVMGALQVLATWRMSRRLRMNTSPFMMHDVFCWVAMAGVSLALGFLNAPIESFFIMVGVISVTGFFTHNEREPHHDASLLLGATGDLSREQLKALVKYLGSYGFGIDYYFQGDSVVIVIPEVRPGFMSLITKRLSIGSRVVIRPDGTCTAYYSPTDLKNLQQLQDTPIDRETAESGLCQTVQFVLHALRDNDENLATSLLAPPLDHNVYKRDPRKLNHWRVQYVISVAFFIGFLIWTHSSTGHWFHYLPKGNWLQLIKGK